MHHMNYSGVCSCGKPGVCPEQAKTNNHCLDGGCANPSTWCGFCVKRNLDENLNMQRAAIAVYLARHEDVPSDVIESIISGEFYTSTLM